MAATNSQCLLQGAQFGLLKYRFVVGSSRPLTIDSLSDALVGFHKQVLVISSKLVWDSRINGL